MERVAREDRETVEAATGVHLVQLVAGAEMSVQAFRIDPGTLVPEHSHPHEQAGYVTQGKGVFLVDGEELPVGPGDSYTIPGGEAHAVENRGDRALEGIDLFSPPRENPDWAE
ncbi:cupin domain-containing protein [Halobacteriales archaeon QS_4_69_34]|nr:MAG: cupin domain-containing protein [Halobacteriales archaeon QS_4_69_34]